LASKIEKMRAAEKGRGFPGLCELEVARCYFWTFANQKFSAFL